MGRVVPKLCNKTVAIAKNMTIALAGKFAWVLPGKVIAFIGSILLVKLLTHSMDVDAYAHLMLGLTICNFFARILMGAAGQGIERFYIDAIFHKEFVCFKRKILKINRMYTNLILRRIAHSMAHSS